jgi:subtilisin
MPRRVNQQTGVSLPMRLLLAIMAAVVALGVFPVGPIAPPPPAAAQDASGEEVIVVLEDGEDPVAAAQAMGVDVKHIYRHVFNGFAGTQRPESDAMVVARSRRIDATISPDGSVQAEAQIVPTGVRRSGVPVAPNNENLDVTSPVDADIAILDTGIRELPDLNVAGGISCVGPDENDWDDDNGHGTHVAGIAAASDNTAGVVGVAPGARLWAVKVLDSRGGGSFSDVICGLDWVVENSDDIDVINLSLSGAIKKGEDEKCNSSAFHQAICAVVNSGVTVVVAAGNQGTNANTRVPAAFDEVIAVSAFADLDGQPGKLDPGRCFGANDDSFLSFSNYGAVVDIAAPGGCILSYSPNGSLEEASGTSEAAPHVAGAAAHFTAAHQNATPAQVQTWLLTEASRSQAQDGVTGDPDVKNRKQKKQKQQKKAKKQKKSKNRKKKKIKVKNKNKNENNNKNKNRKIRSAPREPVLWLEILEQP